MSHNTFDITEEGGQVIAQSHNFKDAIGKGKTVQDAVRSMEKIIIYIKDNTPAVFAQNVTDRIRQGLSCSCGFKLTDPIFWVHGG